MASQRSSVFLDILTRVKGARDVDRLGDSIDDLGDAMSSTAKDASRLDKEIADTEDGIKSLAREIDATGNKELFKDLRKQQRELKQLVSLKDLLGGGGDDDTRKTGNKIGARLGASMAEGLSRAGGGISAALGNIFGTLPPHAQAGIGAALVGAASLAAPLIGGVIGGAVIAGLAAGGVGAGIAAALRDDRVKAEAKSLGDLLSSAMRYATADFVPATIGAIRTIGTEVTRLGPQLRETFAQAAKYVAPLTRGITGLVREALPGISEGIAKAGPVVAALEVGFQRMGRAVGDAISAIADGSSGAAVALSDLLALVGSGVKNVGLMVGGLSKLYAGLRVAFSPDKTSALADIMANDAAAAGFAAEMNRLTSSLSGVGTSAGTTTAQIRSLNDIMKEVTAAATTAFNAETRFGEALSEVTAKSVNHGAGLDANTRKGRENRDALAKLAEQAISSADALSKTAGGQERANAIMSTAYNRFIAVARSMGISRAEADKLATSLGLIPPRTDPKVKVQGTQAAIAEAKRIERKLEEMERTYNATITVKTIYVTRGQKASQGERTVGQGTSTKYSRGGVVEGPGPRGVDSVPALLAPGEGVLTGRGLAALGGRAALDALNKGRPAPAPAGAPTATAPGGGGGRMVLEVVPAASGDRLMDAIVEALRYRIRTHGFGNVQTYLGRT